MITDSKLRREKGNLCLDGISSAHILKLLEIKHHKDVIVTECKNGETWGARDLLKLDAWVLSRSYSPLRTIGYEIKVSRKDFEGDQKWPRYLDLCHEFYFICPAGMIRAWDLPQRIGIIWASKDRLFTKRKAERIEPDINKLNNLLIYVLMSRSQIVANMLELEKEPELSMLDQKRRWVEDANAKKELAFFIKGHVREVYQRLMALDRTFADRERDIAVFKAALGKLGIAWDPEKKDWFERQRVENEIRQLKKTIDMFTIRGMRNLAVSLNKAADELQPLIEQSQINGSK